MTQLFDTFSKIKNKYNAEIKTLKKEKEKDKTKFKILIVDDNDMNLTLASTLVNINFPKAEVINCNSGKQASVYYSEHNPDIVLMDIQMPIMNGYEATGEIRKVEKDTDFKVPIIAVTAGNLSGEKERCVAAGMDDYLVKPLKAQLLVEMIEKYLFDTKQVDDKKTEIKIETNKHFDRIKVLENYGGEEQIVDKLLAMAIGGIPAYMSNLNTAIESNDLDQIKFNAHTIKGMGLGIQFNFLSEYALKIEKAAYTEIDVCKEYFKLLVEEFDFLKKEFGNV